ncbi:MAG: ABC transporter ATP-binding protein, partial [Candidatus Sericytochromatia bacterium]
MATPNPHGAQPKKAEKSGNGSQNWRETVTGAFRYSMPVLKLFWRTAPGLTIWLAICTLIAGLLPAGIAYTGKLLVDSVVAALAQPSEALRSEALKYVLIEGGLIIFQLAAQKGIGVCQALLRALLGNQVNVMILEKALEMSLPQFEDAEFYDRLTRA